MPIDHIVVFLGPTVPKAQADEVLKADYRPPVQQGDVIRAVREGAKAIAIIDGYFGWVPSVWHKEILWALEKGIRVFGAASMGALRAAELDAFGMTGFGTVYRDYKSGALQDDDEVAVMHADEDYRLLSDAMVNIRYTLDDARKCGVVSIETALLLVRYFKSKHFPERRLSDIRSQPPGGSLPAAAGELVAFNNWLPSGFRDVKKEDAVGLLSEIALKRLPAGDWQRAKWRMQPTASWMKLHSSIRTGGPQQASGADKRAARVLSEVRLSGRWPELESKALLQQVCTADYLHGRQIADDEGTEALARFCLSNGISSLTEVEKWLELSPWNFEHLNGALARSVFVNRAKLQWGGSLEDAIKELLVLDGTWKQLVERSNLKESWAMRCASPDCFITGDYTEALRAYRMQRGVPESVDDADLAVNNGWSSVLDMCEDVMCEMEYRRSLSSNREPSPPHMEEPSR